jgi:hypothetical protein
MTVISAATRIMPAHAAMQSPGAEAASSASLGYLRRHGKVTRRARAGSYRKSLFAKLLGPLADAKSSPAKLNSISEKLARFTGQNDALCIFWTSVLTPAHGARLGTPPSIISSENASRELRSVF